jgi:hypothetical protein
MFPARREVVSFITFGFSAGMPRDKRVPLAGIAEMTGLSRDTLYRARYGGHGSEGMSQLLTPLIPQFEAGKHRFGALVPRRDEPNRWEIIET